MKKGLFWKGLVLGIIILFDGAYVIPSTDAIQEEKKTITTFGSLSYIQNLIDNSSDGDTIYIPSGIYYENIIINKSISLVGENKETTIIDGGYSGTVVSVSVDWVNISGFTVQNSGYSGGYWKFAGISIGSYTTISNNIILNNEDGIQLNEHNTIINNIISLNDGCGINTYAISSFNIIMGNIISNNKEGIYIVQNYWYSSKSNTITGNILCSNYEYGIYLEASSRNIITHNTISKGECGLGLYDKYFLGSFNNTISNNTFIKTGLEINLIYWFNLNSHTVLNNTVNGKPLIYLYNETDMVLDSDAGQVFLINCSNITIQNQDLSNTTTGVNFIDTNNCHILNNTINSNTRNGISFQISHWRPGISFNTSFIYMESKNNIISGNTINNNVNGIYFEEQTNNTITNNILGNNYCGIKLFCSENETITSNNIFNNKHGIFIEDYLGYAIMGFNNTITDNTISKNEDGIYILNSNNNTINRNNINSNYNTGIYFFDSSNNNITYNNICSSKWAGIYLYSSSSNVITDNNVLNNEVLGIWLNNSNDNRITNNNLTSNYKEGILLIDSNNNSLSGNSISDNDYGIKLEDSSYNNMSTNTINANYEYGIEFHASSQEDCRNNTVEYNTIQLNKKGVYLNNSNNNSILKNNFLRNIRNALFDNCTNTWNMNYWNRIRILPKFIFGTIDYDTFKILSINIDWHPARKPNELGGLKTNE